MREYIFDGSTIHSLDDWWDAWQNIVRGPEWELFGRSGNAYLDSIGGGPGGPERPCRIVINNSTSLVNNLGIDQTRRELIRKKKIAHSSAHRNIDEQLRLLDYGQGERAYNQVIDPLIGFPGIHLVLHPDRDDDGDD